MIDPSIVAAFETIYRNDSWGNGSGPGSMPPSTIEYRAFLEDKPGAKWLEWYRFMKPTPQGPVFKSPDEVRAECATAGIHPEDSVYLYCFKGARASNTFLALKQAGFKDVRMYFGSWNEWSRDPALPIETGLPTAARPALQQPLAQAA